MGLRNAMVIGIQPGEVMATAWVTMGYVKAKGRIDGKLFRRSRRIPEDNVALGEEMVADLQRRFAMGDYSWLTEGERNRVYKRATVNRTTFEKFSQSWLDAQRGQISEHGWRSYRSAVRDLQKRIGSTAISQINKATAINLRAQWVTEGRAERTIGDRLRLLRQILVSAQDSGLIESVPFEARLHVGRTKRARRESSSRRLTFSPLCGSELNKLLDTLRNPTDATERRYWPLTEFLLLTGLRFGEGAALRWSPDVSRSGNVLTIQRSRPHYGRATIDEPTKTGAVWQIPIREPLADLLRRQRAMSLLGRDGGWVFPSGADTPLHYRNWRRRAWSQLLVKAKVEPREHDAQKALRRTFVCSALMCGRNPKLVAAELGHTTARMVTDQYDSFMNPANWPDEEELRSLNAVYGWVAQGKPGSSGLVRLSNEIAPTGKTLTGQ
jgi:integrase